MKKIILIVMCSVLFFGCSLNKEGTSEIEKEDNKISIVNNKNKDDVIIEFEVLEENKNPNIPLDKFYKEQLEWVER